MSEPPPALVNNPESAYEKSDWRVGWIALAMLGLLLVLAIAVLVLRGAFHSAARDIDRAPTVTPPGPRLQVDPRGDLARLRTAEEAALNRYYWIDRDRGIVHIPIEEAMKQVVGRGLDGFPAAAK